MGGDIESSPAVFASTECHVHLVGVNCALGEVVTRDLVGCGQLDDFCPS